MAKVEEYCEIRTEGGVYRDWLNVAISQSYGGPSFLRVFQLEASEPNGRALVLKPTDRSDISLAGRVMIQEGYIRDRQVAYDANRHAVRVDGYSKAGPITKASVQAPGGGQFRRYKVDAIANTILQRHGINFRVENGPEGWDIPFPNVAVRHGEKVFAMLKRLCRQRGLWMRTEPNGNIVAGSNSRTGGTVLEEGRNILAARCHMTAPEVDEIVLRSQQPGSDSLFGRKAAEVSAKGSIEKGISGRRIVLNEMPASARELQVRADMEAQLLESSFLRVSITHQGWLKPDSEDLWELGEQVSVKSPMLFVGTAGQMSLRVWGIVNQQDAQAGTTTTLELVNERTFGIKFPDAKATDDFYTPKAKPAEPEQPA